MTISNNAYAAIRALEFNGIGCFACRDGLCAGTLFARLDHRWVVSDLDSGKITNNIQRIAVVSLSDAADPDAGLNQAALGIDLEVFGGEWIVDAESLLDLRATYGKELLVYWEQVE